MKIHFTSFGVGALLVALVPACVVRTDSGDDTDESAKDADSGADDDSDDDSDDDASDDDASDDDAADDDASDDDAADDDASDDDAADDDSDDDASDDDDDDVIMVTVIGDGGTSDDDSDDSDDAAAADDSDDDDATATGDAGSSDDEEALGRNGCGSAAADDATIASGSMDEDATWSGTVIVEGNYQVRSSATLTIEAGTHIVMASDASLLIGWNSGASRIVAEGTESAPIVICGESPEAGYWGAFTVGRNVLSNSVMQHVRIFDGGADVDANVVLEAGIELDTVLVSNSASAGVAAVDFDDASVSLSVTDSAKAVILTGNGAITNFPQGGSFSGNTENLARISFASFTVDTVFHDLGIPYLQEGNLQIRSEAIAEFEAGVEYRFSADVGLDVGWNSGDSTIHVNGTEDKPVVFRGANEESGFWTGVTLGRNVRSDSNLTYLEIQDAGQGDTYALDIQAQVKVNNVDLVDNQAGVYIAGQGLDSSSSNLSVIGTGGYPLTVEVNALISIPTGGDFTGNATDQVLVNQSNFTLNGTVPNLGVPYRITGQIQTRSDSSITLSPGTTFVMSSDASMLFGWNSQTATVSAVGTEAEPITFIGAIEEPGSWIGLEVGRNVLSESSFRWVEVAHAGGGTADSVGALRVRESFDIVDCTFSEYQGVGILKTEDDATGYAAANTFDGTAVGNF